jgi:hypothetical protein
MLIQYKTLKQLFSCLAYDLICLIWANQQFNILNAAAQNYFPLTCWFSEAIKKRSHSGPQPISLTVALKKKF